MKRCELCRSWNPAPVESGAGGSGQCRAEPPRVFFFVRGGKVQGAIDVSFPAAFPVTGSHECCGRFRDRRSIWIRFDEWINRPCGELHWRPETIAPADPAAGVAETAVDAPKPRLIIPGSDR